MNEVIFGQDDDDDDDDDHDDGDGGDDDDNEYGSGGRVDGDYSRLLPHVWKIIISNQRGTCSLIHFFPFLFQLFSECAPKSRSISAPLVATRRW